MLKDNLSNLTESIDTVLSKEPTLTRYEAFQVVIQMERNAILEKGLVERWNEETSFRLEPFAFGSNA